MEIICLHSSLHCSEQRPFVRALSHFHLILYIRWSHSSTFCHFCFHTASQFNHATHTHPTARPPCWTKFSSCTLTHLCAIWWKWMEILGRQRNRKKFLLNELWNKRSIAKNGEWMRHSQVIMERTTQPSEAKWIFYCTTSLDAHRIILYACFFVRLVYYLAVLFLFHSRLILSLC